MRHLSSANRVLVYAQSELQSESIRRFMSEITGKIELYIVCVGGIPKDAIVDRHHRVVMQLSEWAINNSHIGNATVISFSQGKFGWIRDGLRVALIRPTVVIFASFYSTSTVLAMLMGRPSRWIIVDDGLYTPKLVGYRKRDGVIRKGPMLSGAPLQIKSLRHKMWSKLTLLFRRLPYEYYSLFPIETRKPQIARHIKSWPNCQLQMGSWTLVVGSYVANPGALAPSSFMRRRQLEIALSIEPQKRIVYLVHPGEDVVEARALKKEFPEVEVLGPYETWKDFLTQMGSLPLNVISYASTLDYMIYQTAEGQAVRFWLIQPHESWISEYEFTNWQTNQCVLDDLVDVRNVTKLCAMPI